MLDIYDTSNYKWVDLEGIEDNFKNLFNLKVNRIFESPQARKNRTKAQIKEIQKYGFRAEAHLVDKFRISILRRLVCIRIGGIVSEISQNELQI